MDRGRGDESVDGSGLESGAGQVADASIIERSNLSLRMGQMMQGAMLIVSCLRFDKSQTTFCH